MHTSFRRSVRLAAAVASLILAAGALAGTAAAGGGGKGKGHKGSHVNACGCAAGLVSLDVAASALGLTEAQLRAELRGGWGTTLAHVAAETGKPVDALAQSISTAATSTVNSLVASGKLTTGQAQAVLLGIPWQVSRVISRPHYRFMPFCGGLLVLDISFAAYMLDMTPLQLRMELNAGKTLVDVAAAVGKTLETVGQTATTASIAGVTAAAATGSLTPTQATELTTAVTQQVAAVVGGLGVGG